MFKFNSGNNISVELEDAHWHHHHCGMESKTICIGTDPWIVIRLGQKYHFILALPHWCGLVYHSLISLNFILSENSEIAVSVGNIAVNWVYHPYTSCMTFSNNIHTGWYLEPSARSIQQGPSVKWLDRSLPSCYMCKKIWRGVVNWYLVWIWWLSAAEPCGQI